jgi:hypothetical protein
MALLDKLQYKQLLRAGKSQKRTTTDEQLDRVLRYAANLLPKLRLKPRKLTKQDVSVVYQYGPRSLFHVRAYTRRQPNAFVIVVTDDQDKPTDHILIDLAAEYFKMNLQAPQFGLFEPATKQDIRRVISDIDPKDDDPFAILGTADGGTYIQTYREPKGFLLEYQLVNPSSHYVARKLHAPEQVIDAMISFSFGKDEWLETFEWKRFI